VVHTCHRRGIHALGGMAAQIPIKRDAALNAQALEKVRQDKLREVRQGHDGTWVAHPGLVPIAREVFDAHMSGPHQIGRRREDVRVSARDLLATPAGDITAEGLHTNLSIALQYLAGWLGGMGCLPIEYSLARYGAARLWQLFQDDDYVAVLSAVTGNQAIQQVQAGLKAIYVSGWQVAADANNALEMYPDQSLYPSDSVPALLRRLNN